MKTNKEIIKEKLEKEGRISNYWCIDTRLTTRLSEYIRQLREEGMEIETDFDPKKNKSKDCIYKLVTKETLF